MLERSSRWPIAAVVLFGHVLLLWLLDEIVQKEPTTSNDSRRSTLFFVRSPQPMSRLPKKTAPDESTLRKSQLAESVPIPKPALDESAPSRTAAPHIDWQHEASVAATNSLQEKQRADALKFSEASKAPAKQCLKPRAPQWRKGTPTYGIAGGLPFVRFHDDRCIFLVVFIGCGFGAKPQADSHLFDNMHNYPNDSSVPDLDECDETP